MEHNLRELEETIGYHFTRRGLLKNAMTHSSYANEQQWEKTRCNERLEFLGDAVLELSTSEFLFRTYKEMPEGELTKTRASLVCEPTLAFCAEEIRLGEYLLLGNGEEATGGRFRPSVVSDAMEALIGAIYLDGGLASAKEFIGRFILNDIEHKQLFYDSKTILQEMGPDHDKSFEACVKIGDEEIGRGKGRTKKAAEQKAAYNGILKIKKDQSPETLETAAEEAGQSKDKDDRSLCI